MSDIIPRARPGLGRIEAAHTVDLMLAADHHVNPKGFPGVRVLGVRGYFRNTLGRPGVNDFGVYDDAIFFLGGFKAGGFASFNANCDPGRVGENKEIDKFFAQLMPGIWPFRQGPHRAIPRRFRQLTPPEAKDHGLGSVFTDGRAAGKFAVRRLEYDPVTDKDHTNEIEWGLQNINIHPGGVHGTGSAGCQTLPPDQYDEFRDLVYAAMAKTGQTWLPYFLTEEKLA